MKDKIEQLEELIASGKLGVVRSTKDFLFDTWEFGPKTESGSLRIIYFPFVLQKLEFQIHDIERQEPEPPYRPWIYITAEEFLDRLDPEIRDELLFHLDLFV